MDVFSVAYKLVSSIAKRAGEAKSNKEDCEHLAELAARTETILKGIDADAAEREHDDVSNSDQRQYPDATNPTKQINNSRVKSIAFPIVTLLARRLRQLQPSTREDIYFASCHGSAFYSFFVSEVVPNL